MFIIIAGATATGKSGAAVELAKKINGEIISADSMQVYRGMDTGTYKITKAEMSGVPHHMIDIAGPEEMFSAAKFKAMAEKIMEEIKSRDKIPVIAGGTGFYINAIIKGIMKANEPSPELKGRLRKELKDAGLESLSARLKELDPECAVGIDLKNSRRVLRALELIEANGVKLSLLKAGTKDTAYKDDYIMFVLDLPRQELYGRIDKRVDLMAKAGLEQEVKNLVNKGLINDSSAMQAIGYKEMVEYINGQYSLETAINRIKQATRNYAKRQVTWFKKYKEAVRVDASGKSAVEIAEEIKRRIGPISPI
jgi:tRNA dimethylallyltransferase